MRIYDPRKFSEFLGNQAVVSFVKKLLISNYDNKIPLPDKVILTGNPNNGQQYLKKIIEASMACTSREEHSCEPCGKCINCVDIFDNEVRRLINTDYHGYIFCEISDIEMSYLDQAYFSLRFSKIGDEEFADYFESKVGYYLLVTKGLLKSIYFMCGNFNNAVRFLDSAIRIMEIPYKDLLENGTILSQILADIGKGDFVGCMERYKKSLAWFGSFEVFIGKLSEFVGLSMVSFLNSGGGDLSFYIEISRNIQWIYDSHELTADGMAEIFFTRCLENNKSLGSKSVNGNIATNSDLRVDLGSLLTK